MKPVPSFSSSGETEPVRPSVNSSSSLALCDAQAARQTNVSTSAVAAYGTWDSNPGRNSGSSTPFSPGVGAESASLQLPNSADISRAETFRCQHPKFPFQVPGQLTRTQFRSLADQCICKGDGCSKANLSKKQSRAIMWQQTTGITNVPKDFALSEGQKGFLNKQLNACHKQHASFLPKTHFEVIVAPDDKRDSPSYYRLVTHLKALPNSSTAIGARPSSSAVSGAKGFKQQEREPQHSTKSSAPVLQAGRAGLEAAETVGALEKDPKTAHDAHGQVHGSAPHHTSEPFIHPARAGLMMKGSSDAEICAEDSELCQISARKITGSNGIPLGRAARSAEGCNAVESSIPVVANGRGESAEMASRPLTVDDMIEEEARKTLGSGDICNILEYLSVVESRCANAVYVRHPQPRPLASHYFDSPYLGSSSDELPSVSNKVAQNGTMEFVTHPDAQPKAQPSPQPNMLSDEQRNFEHTRAGLSAPLTPSTSALVLCDRKRTNLVAFPDQNGEAAVSSKRTAPSKHIGSLQENKQGLEVISQEIKDVDEQMVGLSRGIDYLQKRKGKLMAQWAENFNVSKLDAADAGAPTEMKRAKTFQQRLNIRQKSRISGGESGRLTPPASYELD